MAKRRSRTRSTGSRPPKTKSTKAELPKAAETVAFTEMDEELFRAGAALEAGLVEAPEHDNVYAGPSLWRRLFSRAAA